MPISVTIPTSLHHRGRGGLRRRGDCQRICVPRHDLAQVLVRIGQYRPAQLPPVGRRTAVRQDDGAEIAALLGGQDLVEQGCVAARLGRHPRRRSLFSSGE
jgi:hypothetical protein